MPTVPGRRALVVILATTATIVVWIGTAYLYSMAAWEHAVLMHGYTSMALAVVVFALCSLESLVITGAIAALTGAGSVETKTA